MHRVIGMVAVHQGLVTAWVYEEQNLIGVFAVTSKAVVILLIEQQCCNWHAQGARHGCCASGLAYCMGV